MGLFLLIHGLVMYLSGLRTASALGRQFKLVHSEKRRSLDKTISKLTLPDGRGVLVKNKHQLSNGIHITEKIQMCLQQEPVKILHALFPYKITSFLMQK